MLVEATAAYVVAGANGGTATACMVAPDGGVAAGEGNGDGTAVGVVAIIVSPVRLLR